MKERQDLQQMVWGKQMFTNHTIKLNPLYTKINSKQYKDFDMTPEILKLLEENMGSTLQGRASGKNLLNRTPFTEEI